MRVNNIKRTWLSPIYVHCKKHFCPDCGDRLTTIRTSKIVSSHDPDAKDFDFQNGDTYMTGNVKFLWTAFQCPKCKRQYTVDEMKQIEQK